MNFCLLVLPLLYVHVLNTTGDNAAPTPMKLYCTSSLLYTHVYSYNKCCKRALANASRHVFAFAQKYYWGVIEEISNLQCVLIVSQESASDRLKLPAAKQWEKTFVKGIVSSL